MNFGTIVRIRNYAWWAVIIFGLAQIFNWSEAITITFFIIQTIALVMVITIYLVKKGLRSDLQSLYIFQAAIVMEYIKPTSLAKRKQRTLTYNYMDLYVSMMTDFFDLIMKEVDYHPTNLAAMRRTGFGMKDKMPKDNKVADFLIKYDRTKELEREKNDIIQ